MRIGMILDNEFTGDLRVENEVIALQNAGHDVFVLCFNYGDKLDFEEFSGAKIIRFKISKNFKNKLRFLNNTIFDIYSLLWSIKIKNFAQSYAIKVLHTHDLYMAKSVIRANRKLKLNTVLDLHENYPATLASYTWTKSILGRLLVSPKRWIAKEEKYFSKFSKIILLSEHFKNALIWKYPSLTNKFYVYPNYPSVKKLLDFPIDDKILNKKKDFIIFYFGGIAERRGIFTLLETLRILLRKSKDFKVLLIGPVDKADKYKFEVYLSEKELKDHIIYFAWKDIKWLPSYIHISDVCVSPLIKNDQHESGIANKVFQYMLFEKPLIVSNCFPQQELVEQENCGLVFESENSNDFAEKIKILYENENLRKEIGINAKRAVFKKYNTEISSKNLIKMYSELKGIQ